MHFDLPEIEQWLGDFINFERRPNKNMLNLATMATLCKYFEHPETAMPCFHVAGSKGKGTIANGIAAILRDQGYTTGVYASPHVSHFTERISTGDGAFAPEIYQTAYLKLCTGIEHLIATNQLDRNIITWFELVTILAMLVFREAKVDYAIYEVGMGGRLDTTNIITPVAIAMGPIELEHTEFLGDTLTKIATEKAGIFKNQIPIVSAPQSPEVQAVFKKQATKNHAKIQYITNISDYQIIDAAISATTVQQVFPSLDIDAARKVALATHLPGRYERINNYHGIPYLLLDVAHTVNSVHVILDRMQKDHIHGNLLFACAADKNVEQIASEITSSNLFDKIYLTRPGDFKKSDLPRARKAFRAALKNKKIPIQSSQDYVTTIKKALADSAKSQTPLIIFGSFYLLSEVKNVL